MDPMAAMIPLMTVGGSLERKMLNRLLFFADVTHFLLHGASISSGVYLKINHGPVPPGLFEIRCRLMRAGLLIETEKEGRFLREFSYSTPAGVDLEPLRSTLGPSACRVIDAVRCKLGGQHVSFLSRMAHRFEPWKSATFGFELDLARVRNDQALIQWLAGNGLVPANPST